MKRNENIRATSHKIKANEKFLIFMADIDLILIWVPMQKSAPRIKTLLKSFNIPVISFPKLSVVPKNIAKTKNMTKSGVWGLEFPSL